MMITSSDGILLFVSLVAMPEVGTERRCWSAVSHRFDHPAEMLLS